MPIGDARVDDRNTDARAVETQSVVNPSRADRGAGPLQRALDTAVQADAGDARRPRERVERCIGNIRDLTAHQREAATERSPKVVHSALDIDARMESQDDAR